MKKIGKYLLFFIFVIGSFILFDFYKANDNFSYWSEKAAPEFYGLTKAIIQKDSTFSLEDIRYRIFARDFEDGDLTNDIKVVSNNVDTTKIGEYKVSYAVTDSHKNKTEITVPIQVVSDDAGNYYERTIYSLPSDSYATLTGPRGHNMDRQTLGFLLKQGAKVNIKMVSGPSVVLAKFNTNGNITDGTYGKSLTNDWQSFTAAMPPETKPEGFIDDNKTNALFVATPYKVKEKIVVGIQVPKGEDVVAVPYYHYQDNEDAFRTYWKSIPDSVAIIENQSVTFLGLPGDVDGFKSFGTLDAGLAYFDDIMTKFDELLGLSYDPDEPYNQNVKTKYFFRGARTHNSSLAYLDGYTRFIVINNPRTDTLFGRGWAAIHEIGHAYQGGYLKEDRGMALVEVSNNILCHTIIPQRMGPLANIEDRIHAIRESGKTFRNLGAGDKLYVLVNLLNTFDYKETYAKVAQIARREAYLGNASKYSLADKYVMAFHELYQVDVSPYLEAWGEKISDPVKKMVQDDEVMSILNDVVKNKEVSTKIYQELKKDGKYSLVTKKELDTYGLTGQVKIILDIDDISELSGKKIAIKNASFYKEFLVTKNMIEMTLPIGDYKVELPTPMTNVYQYTGEVNQNITVRNQDITEVKLSYKKNLSDNLIYSTKIDLAGMYSPFSTITLDEKELTISTITNMTHPYFGGQKYASVAVYDKENTLVYEKTYMGNVSPQAEVKKIPYQYGYRIVIYHAEGMNQNRFKITDTALNERPANLVAVKGDNEFYIGKYGFYQETDDYEYFKTKIDRYAEKLTKELSEKDLANKKRAVLEKKYLLTSIYALENEDKDEYLQKYQTIYNGSAPKLMSTSFEMFPDASFDIKAFTKAQDLEDGIYLLTDNNFQMSPIPYKNGKYIVGEYLLDYTLSDLDGNVTKSSLLVKVIPNIKEEKPSKPITPNTESKPTPSVTEEEKPATSVTPSTPSKTPEINTPIEVQTEEQKPSSNVPSKPNIETGEKPSHSTNEIPQEEVEQKEEKTKKSKKEKEKVSFILIGMILACLVLLVIVAKKKVI